MKFKPVPRNRCKLSPNTYLLTLLKQGARITLDNQVYLAGDPENGSITVGYETLGGNYTRQLDENGCRQALEDAKKLTKKLEAQESEE